METPGNCSGVVDCQVGAESEEDAESGPPVSLDQPIVQNVCVIFVVLLAASEK